jgi:hypothetical protein
VGAAGTVPLGLAAGALHHLVYVFYVYLGLAAFEKGLRGTLARAQAPLSGRAAASCTAWREAAQGLLVVAAQLEVLARWQCAESSSQEKSAVKLAKVRGELRLRGATGRGAP